MVSYISPGPDTVMILRASARGARVGFAASAGALAGLSVHMIISAVGLSALLVAAPASLTVLSVGGAIYLAYLGVRAILASRSIRRQPAGLAETAATPGRSAAARSAFQRTLLTNLMNPKVILFFVAVLPQFIDEASAWPVWLQLGILGAADVLVGVFYLPVFVLFGARVFRSMGNRGMANLEIGVGLLLLVFAGALVVDAVAG
nr:LysE family translocator [Nesterenkonia alkaliphila]